jgi:transcriptional regulator GlxA family with amidase domain
MAKKVAVLAVNPVNGFGLFQYLEAFYENGISYRTFAVADKAQIKANSGVTLQLDDVVANLKGSEDKYDALVFACGDAIPEFAANAGKPYNQDMLAVMAAFANAGKLMAGHCGFAVLIDGIPALKGMRVALHPYVRNAVKSTVGTDENIVVDGNLYTAQTEHTLGLLMPELLKALK